MSWWSIPPVVMASITAYVGAYHLLVFVRARRSRQHLLFVAMCASVVVYNLLCVGLYNAATPQAGAPFQAAQAFVIALGGAAFMFFVADYVALPSRRVLWCMLAAVSAVLIGLVPGLGHLLVTGRPEVKHVVLPFGLEVVYNEMAVGPLYTWEAAISLAAFGYAFVLGGRLYHHGERRRATALLCATGLFVLGGINDMLVARGVYPFIYIGEYAFVTLIVLMAFTMAAELVRTTAIEEALRESQRFKELVVAAIPGVIYIFDLLSRRAVYANTNVATLLGYGPEEITGMGDRLLEQIAHPEDLPLIQGLLGRWEKAGDDDVLTSEYRIRARNGEYHWWLGRDKVFKRTPDGRVAQIIGSSHDITERRRAELALQESEERYRKLVEASPSGILLISREGTIVFANPAAARVVGPVSPDELIGRAVLDFIHPSSVPTVLERIQARFASPEIPVPFIARIVRADKAIREIEVVGARVFHEGAPAVLAVGHDITDRMRAEEERARLEGQLHQAQKMEAVGRLAGGVAHDFNNLLQAILSSSEVLASRAWDPQLVARGLAELSEHARRGARLTRQLLVFSRREATRVEDLDLGTVVVEAANLVQRLLRENIVFEVSAANEPLPVRVDRSQLEQVVMNLAINAADAMPAGGALTIRTGAGPDPFVWLEVADTGHGIPEDIRERIWEPFFSTKPSSEGSGLGLSVVHAIVARSGGRIQLDTRVGAGSTFRVLLPRPDPERESPASAPQTSSRAPLQGRGRRILVVEDEEGAREALHGILEMLGYQVEAVGSVAAARALPGSPGFDLALSDVLLPDGMGNELAGELQARWPGIAVVLMSGYAEDVAVREAVTRGDVRFLQKPFDMASLSHELAQAVAGRPEPA